MPQIIVTAEDPRAQGERAVMFTERVSTSDFESDHFQAQLVERLGWAVGDAHALEQAGTHSLEQGSTNALERVTAGETQRRQLEPTDQPPQIEPGLPPRVLTRSS